MGAKGNEACKRYQMASDYVLRKIADDYVIIPTGDGHVFGNAMLMPNRSAGFLWNVFSQPRTLEEAVSLTLEEFDGPQDQIQADIEVFVKEALALKVMLGVDE